MTDLQAMQKVMLELKDKNVKLVAEPDFMRLWYVVTMALEEQKTEAMMSLDGGGFKEIEKC